MYLDKVVLHDVGPFRNAVIPFEKGTDPKRADVFLLTGPNGSGKSTALFAIADVIAGIGGMGELTRGPTVLRMRSADSFVLCVGNGVGRALAVQRAGESPLVVPEFPHPLPLFQQGGSALRAPVHVYQSGTGTLANYWARAVSFRVTPPEARSRFSWAAFAYAGMRTVVDGHVSAIQEPTTGPFQQSLSFEETANTVTLALWLANQQYKRLRAKESGDEQRAETIALSVEAIEQVVSRIIGADFRFYFSVDDVSVRVRLSGEILEMGVLPDGLKSIVSWIADLLMRLDRIPWEGDIGLLERSFLLLLDEVDIHLHPAWQRRVLPIVQDLFPNAQVIASTHSPFVVASVSDAKIIPLKLVGGVSTPEPAFPAQVGISYSEVLRSIFGITSDFDIETEQQFQQFHDAKMRLLGGDTAAQPEVDRLAAALRGRSVEVGQLIAVELRQLERQRLKRSGGA